MTNHYLFDIIPNSMLSCLRLAIAHYENLLANPVVLKKQLLEIDVASINIHYKDGGTQEKEKEKDQGKKRTSEDKIHLIGGREENRAPSCNQVVKRVTKNQREKEGRCMMCERRSHTNRDCLTGWKATTPPP